MANKESLQPLVPKQLLDVGTSEHPTFEELVDYIYHEGFDEYFVREGARINKHVMYCAECYTTYRALLDFKDIVKAYTDVRDAICDLKDLRISEDERQFLLSYIQLKKLL